MLSPEPCADLELSSQEQSPVNWFLASFKVPPLELSILAFVISGFSTVMTCSPQAKHRNMPQIAALTTPRSSRRLCDLCSGFFLSGHGAAVTLRLISPHAPNVDPMFLMTVLNVSFKSCFKILQLIRLSRRQSQSPVLAYLPSRPWSNTICSAPIQPVVSFASWIDKIFLVRTNAFPDRLAGTRREIYTTAQRLLRWTPLACQLLDQRVTWKVESSWWFPPRIF